MNGRRGVSLLEVLFSIFIMMFGLLGVLSMLTLGRSMTAKIDRHDSATVCGTAAIHRVAQSDGGYQEFLRPAEPAIGITGWTSPDIGRFYYNATLYPTTTQPNDTAGLVSPVLIDPIGYSQSAGTNFPPTNASEPRQLLSNTTAPLTLSMPRLTLRAWNGTNRIELPRVAADRMFAARDGIITADLSDQDTRTRAMVVAHEYNSSGTYVRDGSYAVPVQPNESANPPAQLRQLYHDFDGVYTWAVMATPQDDMWGLTARQQTKFRAWVLVFQKRTIAGASPPSERTVVANMIGGGVGGGEVKLTTSVDPSYLSEVRKDNWLMLCGVDNLKRARCQWYQIRHADREVTTETASRWSIRVSLAGPDWPVYVSSLTTQTHWCDKQRDSSDPDKFVNTAYDLDGDGFANDVLALIVDDLVSVRENPDIQMPPY